MQAGLGPLTATGVALVSAGALAIAPVAPPLDDVAELPVQLAAESDWSVIFDRAGQGAGDLVSSFFDPAFPVSQQVLANQIGYLGQLPDVGGIVRQIVTNTVNGLNTPAVPTDDTLDDQHSFIYNALPVITQVPLVDLLFEISPTGQRLLDFATSHISGVLLGAAGPLVGPVVVLAANLQSIIADLDVTAPDLGGALNTLLNTPAQMTDAFLNGGVHVDVTALVEALGPTIGVTFPEGTKIGIAFGGLLSPGGSAFNAMDLDYDRDILGLPLVRFNLATGQGPGFFGSLIEMHQAIARAIGWNGRGNPLAPSEGSAEREGLAPVDEVPTAGVSSALFTLDTAAAEKATPAEEPTADAAAAIASIPVEDEAGVVEAESAGVEGTDGSATTVEGDQPSESDVEPVADQSGSAVDDLDEATSASGEPAGDEPAKPEDAELAGDVGLTGETGFDEDTGLTDETGLAEEAGLGEDSGSDGQATSDPGTGMGTDTGMGTEVDAQNGKRVDGPKNAERADETDTEPGTSDSPTRTDQSSSGSGAAA